MGVATLSQSNQNTQDNIATRDSNQNYIVKRNKEKFIIEENTTKVTTNTLGHSWIVGSSTNGIVGTNTSTEDGSQQVVGSAGRDLVLIRVVNPNNIFREHFRDDTFKDASNTTADWNVSSSLTLEMTVGETAQSWAVDYNNGTITKATVNIDFDTGDASDITFQLAANGSTYETVTIGTEHSFTVTGHILKFKITALDTAVINSITISRS